ncbi:MAG: hypothetical protein LBL90_12615 [Prevotellaceae bacterium]|jgi:cell division protein FtsL|nr:hypothetical protein [Prevotellaceae bacterium]
METTVKHFTQVTRGNLITWCVSVLIFALGIVATSWTALNTRIRDLEVQVKILQVKTEQHEDVINEVKLDLKDIKVLLHDIDKKLEHKQDIRR